jgi:hypothetical protein
MSDGKLASDHTHDQSEEGGTFNQSGCNDHRTANVASNFWLTSHALNRSSTNLGDAESGAQHYDSSTSSTGQINQSRATSSRSSSFLSHCRNTHCNKRSRNEKAHFKELSHNKTPLSIKTRQSDAACLGRPAKPISEPLSYSRQIPKEAAETI